MDSTSTRLPTENPEAPFGSFARGEESADSDIDLMVIGSLGLRDLITMLANTQDTILREINPHVHSEDEFRKKIQKNDHFVSQVVAGPKIFILGSEDELKAIAQLKNWGVITI